VDQGIFISHATEDQALVEAFDRRARRYLLTAWWSAQIRAGEALWPTITQALDDSRLAILLLTPASLHAAQQPDRGLHTELAYLSKWSESPQSAKNVVIVDCVGVHPRELFEVEALRPWSGNLFLDGTAAFGSRSAVGGIDEPAIDVLVRELLVAKMDGGVEVFPASNTRSRQSFVEASWVGCTGASRVIGEPGFSRWDGEIRQRIPLRRADSSCEMALEVVHAQTARDWWAATVGFAVGPHGEWLTGDIRGFDSLEIVARAEMTEGQGVPLGVRLEDDATDAAGGSFHQSSSMAVPAPLIREYFSRFVVGLEKMQWGVDAYDTNTRPVAKDRILQVSLGPTAVGTRYAGLIRIKSLRLTVDRS
jgi:hypothetical protein